MNSEIFARALRDTNVGVVITDATQTDNPIVFVNDAFTTITGFSQKEATGKNCRFLQGMDRDQPQIQTIRDSLGSHRPCTVTLRNYRKDRSFFWNEVNIAPIRNDRGEISQYVGVMRDVTERVLAEEKLRRIRKSLTTANVRLEDLAQHDGLTGIYNRRFFDRMLRRQWGIAGRDRKPLSILILDIDNFKEFNDTLGHPAGDECLRAVAKMISSTLRRGGDFVARYGGDEFVALMFGAAETEAYELGLSLCDRARDIEFPDIEETEFAQTTLSIGIATMIPHRDSKPEHLIGLADKALLEAKHTGKDRVITYQSMQQPFRGLRSI